MPLPSIKLKYPQILVTPSNSPTGINPYGNNNFIFGSVQDVYSGSDLTTIGDTLIFDRTKYSAIVYGSSVYYIVDEQNAVKEPFVP